jgi:hypothetical protein
LTRLTKIQIILHGIIIILTHRYYFVTAKLLGFDDYIPTFNRAKATKNILRGINYASGSAGIRNESGRLAVVTTFVYTSQAQR